MDRAFRDHASATPQKEAVIDGSLTLTYSQLLAEAESVAAVLRESGLQLKQDEPIGIVIEPSYRHIISQVAVRMLQATCMPFDPASPPERIRGMLDDIGARCVIVQEDLDLGMDLVQIRLDGLSKRMSNPNLSQTVPTENSQKSCVGASERSHILFTSGSTGRPKAVQIMERAILNLAVETSVTPLQGNDRVAEFNNPGFDLSLFEIWVPLLSGAGVVVVPRSMITDPANISSFLVKNKVTVAIVPTALFNILTTTVPDVFRGLRHVIVAGESPNPSIMRNVLQHGPPAHLWNGYGPTECTTVVTMCEVTDEEAQNSRIAIGSPIGNTQVFLLHGDQLAGEGEEGEICVTGPGLSPGYINRSHENAKAFIELTQAALKVGGDANSRVRLYRTGDIGRPRGDRTGCIEYIGRRDNQVKHMGFRVELDEIENILQGHEHVAGAAVVHQAPASSASSSILTAYIMMKQRQSWNPVELRRFVQKHFPFFMIPTRFEEVLEFPLTPNGKLDRRELVKQARELPKNTFRTDQGVLNQRPKAAVTVMNGTTPDIKKHSNGFTNHDHTREVREMYPEALQGDQESSANSRPHYIKRNQIFSRRPESPGDGVSLNGLSQGRSTEDTIADIWKELLDIAALKESDDFFLLGGTSMQSAALIALIHQRTGRLLTMDEVHANSQFSQLVRFIKGESKGHSCPSSEQVEQWLRDTELGQDVGIVPNWDSPDEGRVFLTGATGFLGSYLLRQLIENPNVEQVACLVRSKDSESAPRRLQKALSKYDLWPVDYELSRKIRVLEGSLAEPSLGLDRDTFRWLTNWASVVFHVGAKVNFCEGYQEHYRDNVLGTRHALEVAIRGRRKSFQYVSSLDVWGPTGFILGTKQVKEDDPLIRHFAAVRYDTGYSQSQWVAESIVQQVQAQGLPVAIYRPGFILGHSQTGAGNPGDVIGRLIMGCIKLGEFPRIMNKRFEYIPVDHVVGAILHIASSTANLGSAYHLVPSDQTISPTMNDTYTLLRELGYQLKLVDFNEWLEDVVVSTGSLAPVLPLLREKALGQFTRWEVSQHSPRYDCSNTLRALNASNKKGLGSITADMLGRYIAFWKRKGFFES